MLPLIAGQNVTVATPLLNYGILKLEKLYVFVKPGFCQIGSRNVS